MDNIDDEIYIKHYSSLKGIAKDHMKKPEDLPPGAKTAKWWYGAPGTGKTHAASTEYPGAYRKAADTKWWDGYNNEEVVIIDDFDKYHIKESYHLKIWLDRYAFLAEVKNGACWIRPKLLIITSNYRPEDIWTDPMTLGAIKRRCEFTHFQTIQEELFGTHPEDLVRPGFSGVEGFQPPSPFTNINQ